MPLYPRLSDASVERVITEMCRFFESIGSPPFNLSEFTAATDDRQDAGRTAAEQSRLPILILRIYPILKHRNSKPLPQLPPESYGSFGLT